MGTIYIGNYGSPRGIYEATINEVNGAIELKGFKETPDEVAYMIYDQGIIFTSYKSINKEENHGGLGSFDSNTLYELSHATSHGRSYTHLCLDKDKHYVFGANYHAGTTVMYSMDKNIVKDKISIHYHDGKGIDPLNRQLSSHCHYVGITPDNYLYVCDLGGDEIVLFDYQNGKLEKKNVYKAKPGSGPRHMIFNSKGNRAYLIAELTNEVTLFDYNDGIFTPIETICIVPTTFKEFSAAAAIELDEEKGLLFVSNRGYDHVTVIDVKGDYLHILQQIPVDKNARDIKLMGNILIVASQGDSTVETFMIKDQEVIPCNSKIKVDGAICIAVKND